MDCLNLTQTLASYNIQRYIGWLSAKIKIKKMRKEVEKTIHQNVTGSYFFRVHPKPPKRNNILSCGHLINKATAFFIHIPC